MLQYYVIDTDKFYLPEIKIENIQDDNFTISPKDSAHYDTNTVRVYYPSSFTVKDNISNIPGLLTTYKSPVSFADAKQENIREAIINSAYEN
ncbi:MAG: hypothetical protein LBC44_01835, partial [Mycoplasmataceae bacterium]|nr:hypothetical protein [Mycoplasmataceae bacterium]